MLYFINGRNVSSYEFNNSMELHAEREARLSLNDMLNKIYGDLCIEGCTIGAAEIFESCRPKEYKAMLRDRFSYIDNEAFFKARAGEAVTLGENTYTITLCDES